MGAGIRISGALTSLERNHWLGKYGLSYGPEFDANQQKALWQGHPIEITYKTPSRAVAGDLYLGDK